MSEIMEQRSAIKFCVRNGISAAETLRMCQKAYGDGALSQARVFAWHRMFKEGRESVQDEPRAGRLSTSTDVIHVQKIRDLVLANRRLTVRDLTDLVGISEGSVKTILSDHLGLRKVKARLVPKSLNFLEKQRRVDVSETMLSDYRNRMKNIITGDESWIYNFRHFKKRQITFYVLTNRRLSQTLMTILTCTLAQLSLTELPTSK
ncbi:SETMR methyltransferase, partial [Acromyrmex charruanus]